MYSLQSRTIQKKSSMTWTHSDIRILTLIIILNCGYILTENAVAIDGNRFNILVCILNYFIITFNKIIHI